VSYHAFEHSKACTLCDFGQLLFLAEVVCFDHFSFEEFCLLVAFVVFIQYIEN
jgi:hypothetical protein